MKKRSFKPVRTLRRRSPPRRKPKPALTCSMAETRVRLKEMLDLALAGGDVVVTRWRVPVVRLVPVSDERGQR